MDYKEQLRAIQDMRVAFDKKAFQQVPPMQQGGPPPQGMPGPPPQGMPGPPPQGMPGPPPEGMPGPPPEGMPGPPQQGMPGPPQQGMPMQDPSMAPQGPPPQGVEDPMPHVLAFLEELTTALQTQQTQITELSTQMQHQEAMRMQREQLVNSAMPPA